MEQYVAKIFPVQQVVLRRLISSIPFEPTGFVSFCAKGMPTKQPENGARKKKYLLLCERLGVQPYTCNKIELTKLGVSEQPSTVSVKSRVKSHLLKITISAQYATIESIYDRFKPCYQVSQIALVSGDKSVRVYFGCLNEGLELVIDEPAKNHFAQDVSDWFEALPSAHHVRLFVKKKESA
ncbi:MAG: hypothetical protein Q7K43_04625 [Candidatus Woesearchaeota archaeon]|nr:hypothetical protein [Candidatus Woesearchaeota archaeon]